MDYKNKPLFPLHEGPVQIPVYIREVSDTNSECFYMVSVYPSKLHNDGVEYERFFIYKFDKPIDNRASSLFRVSKLNIISDAALKEFVFVDDGSFYVDKLDLGSVSSNMRRAQRLAGKELFNLCNVYAPLRIYRLKREYNSICLEKPTSNKVCKTYWDMEVLDHTGNVPCSRSGHSVLVDRKNNRLFVVGGVTVLADKSYQGNIEDIGNNWYYYPLHDVWKLDLKTGEWDRMMDLNFNWRRAPSMIPKVLSNSFKLPDLLTNVALVYDYKNDLIYGCFSPLKCLEIVIQSKYTFLFSIDPLTQCVKRECTYKITVPSTMLIAYDHSRLVVHFTSEKKADVCVIPYTRMGKIKGAILSKKLLPRRKLRQFAVTNPIRFIGDNFFSLHSTLLQPSEDPSKNWNIGKAWYLMPPDHSLKNLFR